MLPSTCRFAPTPRLEGWEWSLWGRAHSGMLIALMRWNIPVIPISATLPPQQVKYELGINTSTSRVMYPGLHYNNTIYTIYTKLEIISLNLTLTFLIHKLCWLYVQRWEHSENIHILVQRCDRFNSTIAELWLEFNLWWVIWVRCRGLIWLR